MQPLAIAPDTQLRLIEMADAAAFHDAVTAHHADLDPWLRWSSSIKSSADAVNFVEMFVGKSAQTDGFHLGVWQKERLVGGVICWYINQFHRNAEVGYWLIPPARGRGLATRATRAVVDHLFAAERLHRVELQCAVTNAPSRRLAERLGFQLEGIRRGSHWLTSRFLDHAVYGALEGEWRGA